VLGLCLSGAAYLAVQHLESGRLRDEFSRLASDRVAAVRQGVAMHIEQVRSIRRLYVASREVERGEFRAFVGGILSQYRAVQAVGWAPRVLEAEREATERGARDGGAAGFRLQELDEAGRLRPAEPRASWHPIFFLEPPEENDVLWGLDLASRPGWWAAMEEARDTGKAMAGPVGPPVGQADGPLWLPVFVAIFRNDLPHETAAQRRAAIAGFAVGFLRVGDLVEDALAHLAPGSAELCLYDASGGEPHRLLYVRGAEAAPRDEEADDAEPWYARMFEVAGRRWVLHCTPSARFGARRREWPAWGVLGVGLLFTALLTAYVRSAAGRSIRIEELVAERTAQLSRANAELEREVAERERAEAALAHERNLLRALIDNMPDYIFVKDRDSRFLLNNVAHARILGAEKPQDVLGHTDRDYFPRDLAERYLHDEQRVVATGEAIVAREEPTVDPAGHPRWVSTTKVPLRDPAGAIVGLVGISRDVSDRRQAEDQLRQALAELERSNQELEQFAYVASHDLQEPLRMVSSYVQLLARRYRDKLDADARDFISFAAEGAQRMQTLISDLLTYSRVGRKGEELRPVSCDTVVEQAIGNLQAAIEDAGATVTHDPLPTVVADETQLLQLFQNLIANAIKFRGAEPSRVHVGARREGGEWVFAVRDNGIGIDPQYADRIFLIFQRLHTREEYAGTGIGLAICRKIVERYGGRIGVDSEPGQGSTFSFTLPAMGDTPP
jgi:PAS domain S-box-containing protein